MKLVNTFIRFYKSFNYDYLRKWDAKVRDRMKWESIGDAWYPYVKIPIDRHVTTIVGENESGKSHLLTAIEKGLTGIGLTRKDFCRYSTFFAVREGEMRWSDFGFEWADLTTDERASILKICEIDSTRDFDRFFLFRTDLNVVTAHIPNGSDFTTKEISSPNLESLAALLPKTFRLKERIALPESVPLGAIIQEQHRVNQLESLEAIS